MLSLLLPALPALIGTLIRSATIAGGATAVVTADPQVLDTGVLTGDDIQAAMGAVAAAVAAIWGIVEKLRRKQP